MLSWIITGMIALAVLCGAVNGTLAEVSAAATEGAQAAVTLCVSIAGPMLLWSGTAALLERCGAIPALTRALAPALKRLFPRSFRDREISGAIGANIAANILGLGNAATPLGMRAAALLGRDCSGGIASDELCTLVILNTASMQLLPVTVAAVRAGHGAAAPYDILPAVWAASALSLAAGLLVRRIFVGRRG